MSASSTYFIGVDGGGTKTAISVVSESGSVLSSLTVGSSNPNSVSDAGASQTIQAGIRQALAKIDGDVSGIRSVVLSISGCNSAADGLRMNGWLSSWLPDTWSTLAGAAVSTPASVSAPLVASYNDSIAALVSGTAGKLEGVVLIAGTGMICKGFRSASGTDAAPAAVPLEWTSGGNGALIDSGSGYMMGLNVIRACFAAHDGMGPPTPLLQATLDLLQKERSEQLVDWLYADMSWSRLATLAPLAFKFAVAGSDDATASAAASSSVAAAAASARPVDPVSLHIVEDAADYLVRSVRAVVTKQQFADVKSKVTVVCAGGLLQNPQLFGLVRAGILAFLPQAELVYPSVSPSEGAALLALAQWKEQQEKRK